MRFLMESNQELLIFFNALQLKILWTMLFGTFLALRVVCYDLLDLFQGSYQITSAVGQLYIIQEALHKHKTNYKHSTRHDLKTTGEETGNGITGCSHNDKKNHGGIGLLDILGFEIFETNCFEQFVSTTPNKKKLHYKYVSDVVFVGQE
mmetsp:Transcript_15366/g.19207  ORF Transcript_15366/g.19207 Transcript_15366/m.19207 type:complete len:149 (+) Transcript_15366:1027-1473(+)